MADNLRSSKLPANLILFASGDIPNGFLHECRFDNKYAIGIPCGVTNPSTEVGATTHQHSSGGVHAHTYAGPGSHTHYATGNNSSGALPGAHVNPLQPISNIHYHTTASDAGTCAPITAQCSASHQHTSSCNDPTYKTLRHVRVDGSNHNPRKGLDTNTMLLWGGTIASLPGTIDANHYGKYIKQVACGCASSGSTGGSNTHTHGCDSAHTHTVTVGAHTHSIPNAMPYANSVPSTSGNNNSGAGPQPAPVPGNNQRRSGGIHNHPSPTGNLTVGSTGACATSCNSDAQHNHSSDTNEPSHITTALFTKNEINLRSNGLPSGSMGLWLESLACIPTGYQTADGTNGTLNFFNKYIKIIPCGSTNPGSSGGNACHAHSSAGAHAHAMSSASHSHPVSGGSPGPSASFVYAYNFLGGPSTYECHTHSVSGQTSSAAIACPLGSGGGHTHASFNHKPLSVETAIIVKV